LNWRINKLILNYLFHDYQQAEQFSLEAQPYLNATMGYPLYVLYYFYDVLNQLSLYDQTSPENQSKILTEIEENQSKLQLWASHAPMNFQHKVDLVAAERAKISGDLWQASELYEQAIAGANKYEYPQEEALAYELAARFYYQQGKRKIAQTYFREAHYLYSHWGAIAKVRHLENCYPQFLPRQLSDSALTQTLISSNGTQTNILDLNSVFKASQTLSSALKRETLLKKIMEIIIENAGAETGYLLRQNQDQWFVEARASIGEKVPEIIATDLTKMLNLELPESVINYVARTEKKVLLNQANSQGDFTQDPYIQQAQIKSIFCFPLIYQGVMKAIIYLENKLLENAFTTDRLEILKLISTQAAISLENVNLYETLEQQVYERTEKLSTALENLQRTQSQLIESEKMAALGNLVAGVAHEISTPIGTSITIASFFACETTNFLQTCTTGQLKRSTLNEYLKIADESSKMLMGNLNRAGDLVNNFKQVAVDQTILEKRTFNLQGYIHDLLVTLLPELRHRQITTVITGDESLFITSYPGIFSQIITNLVMNSLKHAYHNQAPGNLTFKIEQKNNILYLKYNDDGCGIAPEYLPRIFEPFFTTTRGRGGTGLGLHIVYNLVRQMLKGTITCHSEVNQGTEFLLELPLDPF
jgi:signal transduction histidine kinase